MSIRLIAILAWILWGCALAADPGMGTPFMTQWSRAELKIHTANRKVMQGPNGMVYVGNGSALLEFDGVRWHKYELPNETRVRDFSFHEGLLYAGTTSDLLVLRPDASRHLQWQSLIADWPAEKKRFGDIWYTVSWGQWVVFLAEEHLFVWDGQQVHDLKQPDGQLDMLVAAGGRLWVSNRKGQLFQFFPDTLQLRPVLRFPEEVRFRDALDWPDGRILLFSRHHGLWWLHKGRLQAADEAIQGPLRDQFLYDAELLPDGSVAVATIGHGLLLLGPDLHLLRRLTREDGLFSNLQAAVGTDDQGGLWSVGDNGLQRLQWPSPLTRVLPQAGDEIGGVDQLLLFRNAPLLVADGLVRVHQTALERSPRLDLLPGSSGQTFGALALDNHQLLVAREGGFWLAEVDAEWRLHWKKPLHEMLFGWHLVASRSFPGRYYGIGSHGLVQLERQADGRWASRHLVETHDLAHRVAEDEKGRVWAGGNIGKLYRYDPASGEVRQWSEVDGLAPGNVVPFWLDGQLVIGTTDGLKQWHDGRFVPARNVPEFLTRKGNEIYRIIRDQRGNYWVRLGDHNGVLEQTVEGWVWNEAPLLPIAASVSVNFFEDPQGIIWIADGSGQVYRYNPAQPPMMEAHPRVLLRKVSLRQDNRVIYGGAGFSGWRWPVLKPEENALRFEYALTRFVRNDATEYRSRLQGMESQWTPWSRETRRDVTNLGAGSYTLQLQARDVFGQQYEARIAGIQVQPFWYATTMAKAVYLLLLLLAGYWLFRLGHRWRLHQLEKEKTRLSALVDLRTREVRKQARKLEEMNEAKSRFFANVSHEFRTPLTLTIGPLETVCKEQGADLPESTRRYLHLALANARRMLALVGQILDINRLEAGRMPLRVAEADLAGFLRLTAERFQPRMQQLGIHFETRGLEEPVLLYYDVDHMDKVVGNLLSNASKFTPEGGQVILSLETGSEQVVIRVADSGPGVADEEKLHIFRRYYQSARARNATQPGTGIGLALCKELVMLHHGHIRVEDRTGGGAVFVLELPRGHAHFDPQDLVQPEPGTAPAGLLSETLLDDPLEQEQQHEGQTLVLVVDDNAELRAFLRMRLEGEFRVMEAADGHEALECMRREPPDVVVSDQMMPGMDGLQLLEAIRADAELMATPVLMLSAKSTHRDTVEGLQAGADDYLAKPFDSAELIVRLQALLAHRARLRQQLEQEWMQRQSDEARIPLPEPHLPDSARKLLQLIESRLHDSGFNIEEMAREMAMERSTLYRNCREWFDCSPSELLRRERLLRARTLLQQGGYTVAEVAYAVGFDSHAYFSRCFKQETGLSPSAFQKKGPLHEAS